MTTHENAQNATIFVSIASFRDQFLPFTIRACLDQAAHPDRLRFGICWQAGDDEALDDAILGDPRMRIRRYPYAASLGYGWSRAEVQKLYAGEDYHLLIDSHTWLAPGWDVKLIHQLEGKPTEKALLSTSSPPFTFSESGEVMIPWRDTDLDGVPLMTCERLRPIGWIDIQMSGKRKSAPHETTALICCNFVFTRGRWIREVPEDPGMINAGHEAALSVRSWTHGWDTYLPDEILVWHLDYSNYPGGQRRKVWEAKSEGWQHEHTDRMIQRLRALFYGGDPTILGRYRLGSERSLEAWAKLAELDLS
ncbi:MAG: GlcNAc-transferase family protein [Acidobacteriota bacterium]